MSRGFWPAVTAIIASVIGLIALSFPVAAIFQVFPGLTNTDAGPFDYLHAAVDASPTQTPARSTIFMPRSTHL